MSTDIQPLESVQLTPEQERSRRVRNIAIALLLGGLVVLFWLTTIVRLGANVFDRPI